MDPTPSLTDKKCTVFQHFGSAKMSKNIRLFQRLKPLHTRTIARGQKLRSLSTRAEYLAEQIYPQNVCFFAVKRKLVVDVYVRDRSKLISSDIFETEGREGQELLEKVQHFATF